MCLSSLVASGTSQVRSAGRTPPLSYLGRRPSAQRPATPHHAPPVHTPARPAEKRAGTAGALPAPQNKRKEPPAEKQHPAQLAKCVRAPPCHKCRTKHPQFRGRQINQLEQIYQPQCGARRDNAHEQSPPPPVGAPLLRLTAVSSHPTKPLLSSALFRFCHPRCSHNW